MLNWKDTITWNKVHVISRRIQEVLEQTFGSRINILFFHGIDDTRHTYRASRGLMVQLKRHSEYLGIHHNSAQYIYTSISDPQCIHNNDEQYIYNNHYHKTHHRQEEIFAKAFPGVVNHRQQELFLCPWWCVPTPVPRPWRKPALELDLTSSLSFSNGRCEKR